VCARIPLRQLPSSDEEKKVNFLVVVGSLPALSSPPFISTYCSRGVPFIHHERSLDSMSQKGRAPVYSRTS
jgi:hypothetical protein